jgi:hypothetical protein
MTMTFRHYASSTLGILSQLLCVFCVVVIVVNSAAEKSTGEHVSAIKK